MISIHALREEGDIWKALCWSRPILISIHALREEGDLPKKCRALPPPYFYPRPPRGGRQWQDKLIAFVQQFLSTPSARRATAQLSTRKYAFADFYPRPPRGGRRPVGDALPMVPSISIHALREEGDMRVFLGAVGCAVFLSTPSARRATASMFSCSKAPRFLSTPSARRATSSPESSLSRIFDFYPRPPRGGRQQKQRQNLYFQTNYTTFCTNLEEP